MSMFICLGQLTDSPESVGVHFDHQAENIELIVLMNIQTVSFWIQYSVT